MSIPRLLLVLAVVCAPGATLASPSSHAASANAASTDALRAQVIHELEVDGVSLKDSPHQLLLRARSHGMVVVIVDRQGEELARRTVEALPVETEAAVAHLSIIVDGMLKRIPERAAYEPAPRVAAVEPEPEPVPGPASNLESGVERAAFSPAPFMSVSIGRGIGSSIFGVRTEVEDLPVSCCGALSGETLRVELGYWRTRLSSLSLVGRLTRSHTNLSDSKYAPAVTVRAYRAIDRLPNHLQIFGLAGWGALRHDIQIADDPLPNGQDRIDYHDSGPLHFGFGLRASTSRQRPVQAYFETSSTLPISTDPMLLVHIAYTVGISGHLP